MIEPQSGSVKQAFANTQVPRIGIIRKKLLENGQKRVLVDLEVANLEDQETLIIGLDLFKLLGYEISNIPFTWPQPSDNHAKKMKPSYDDIRPNGVDQNGIAEEWKKVLEDNQALPKNSKCKLPDAELTIETKGDPVWIRQYPIPEGYKPAVDAKVQEWIKNGTVVPAPPIANGIYLYLVLGNLERMENLMLFVFVLMAEKLTRELSANLIATYLVFVKCKIALEILNGSLSLI